jgi:hypothetical protein
VSKRVVYWSVLLAPEMNWLAVHSLLKVAIFAGARGFVPLFVPVTRVERARNRLASLFLAQPGGPDDLLVMLDADHQHPEDVVVRLARHDVNVVGALAFQRTPPYRPCVHLKKPDGGYVFPADCSPENGLVECAFVGMGAIAIKRWVFQQLQAKGFAFPWFRHAYPVNPPDRPRMEGNIPPGEEPVSSGEDVYFGRLCELAGIPHYCDFSLVTPHIAEFTVDTETWAGWQKHLEQSGRSPSGVGGVEV